MERRGVRPSLDDIRRTLRLGDGAVPGRLLHLPGDRDPPRRRAARRRRRRPCAARLPAGALEGRPADPLRRPAAPGDARRLDLPGTCSTWSTCPHDLRHRRRRRRARRPDGRGAARRGGPARRHRGARGSARPTWRRRRSTCSGTSGRRRRQPGRCPAGPRRVQPRAPVRACPGRHPRRLARVARRSRPGSGLCREPGARTCCCRPPPGSPGPRRVVPESMAGGDLRAGGSFLFVGLPRAQGLLSRLSGREPEPCPPSGLSRRARWSWRPPLGRRADLDALSAFARRFDRAGLPRMGHRGAATEGRCGASGSASRRCSASTGAARRGESCRSASGRRVFEVPTLPPSVPGIRLFEL